MASANFPKSNLAMVSEFSMNPLKEVTPGTPKPGTYNIIPIEPTEGMKVEADRETNADEVTGVEGATDQFESSRTSTGAFTQSKLKPNFLIQILSGFFGKATPNATGATSWRHDIETEDNLSNHPTFTAKQRLGNAVAWEEYPHLIVNEFSLSLSDKWAAGSMTLMGSGARNDEYRMEKVTDLDDVVSLTLAANAVKGSDDASRLANAEFIRVKKTGETKFTYFKPTAVSGATPAVLTIPDLGGAGASVDYFVFYREAGVAFAVSGTPLVEPRLRVTDCCIKLDGEWDGAIFDAVGGYDLGVNLFGETFEITGNLGGEMIHIGDCSSQLEAQEFARAGREVSISVSQRMFNSVYRELAHLAPSDPLYNFFSVTMKLAGPVIDEGDVEKFGAVIHFPKCAIANIPELGEEKGQLSETYEFQVLVDDTFGLVQCAAWNRVPQYI